MREAAARGDAAAVARFITGRTPLNDKDRLGQTALLLAVAGNHVEVARLLMEAGADINAQAANRDTPWLLAGALGRAEIIALMLPRKPDLSIRNRFGGTALIPACERAHVEAVKLLLTSGIDVNHANDLGWTCLLEIVILGSGAPPSGGGAACPCRSSEPEYHRPRRCLAPRPRAPEGAGRNRAADRGSWREVSRTIG